MWGLVYTELKVKGGVWGVPDILSDGGSGSRDDESQPTPAEGSHGPGCPKHLTGVSSRSNPHAQPDSEPLPSVPIHTPLTS